MSRRVISIVIMITMVFSLLAACGGGGSESKQESSTNSSNNSSNSGNAGSGSTVTGDSEQYGDTGGLKLPIVDKPVTLTWMHPGNVSITNEMLVVKEIEKRTGIKVVFQTYSSQTYEDKLRTTVASGNLPDIFNGLKGAELKDIGKQGGVVAINEHVDMLPNFKKLYMEENPWVIKSFGDQSGNLYSWPIYKLNRDVNHGFMYRKDIFDNNGIKPWTNTDEFYTGMKKLKELYPNSYPYASKTKEHIYGDWSYGWGIGGENYPIYYDEADRNWKFASVQDAHKDMLDFMKKMFNEGLLDPEFLTNTQDSWTTKMTTDKAFVTFDWIGRLDLFYNQVKSAMPDYNLRYALPIGPTGHVRSLPEVSDYGIAIADNDNKEVALKLLDYLTSPSGGDLMTLGVEGVNFKWGEDGYPVYPDLANLPLVDISVLEDRYGMWQESAYLRPNPKSVYFKFSEKEQEAQDLIMKDNRREQLDPTLNFTDDEIATLSELQTSIQKAAEEFNSKYVMDKNYGDKQWEDWKNTAKKAGIDQMLAIFNEAQKRFDSK
ncbi:extracellular solute-binding protein [Paenibacillaceae sp. P-4]|uniref:extracellular solute-binding protein n=1 Tax=Paenibacillaceae bacterium P-4 TaxID=3160969 RepID=UPI0032E81BFF